MGPVTSVLAATSPAYDIAAEMTALKVSAVVILVAGVIAAASLLPLKRNPLHRKPIYVVSGAVACLAVLAAVAIMGAMADEMGIFDDEGAPVLIEQRPSGVREGAS